jgi:hypothetical protein
METFYKHHNGIPLPQDSLKECHSLETRQAKLLLEKEEWKLKSRDLWIEVRDQNMKFFQNFANHRKHVDTIWIWKTTMEIG